MDELLLDVDPEGAQHWPQVEDRGDIDSDEFFLVTVELAKGEEKELWVLPAQAVRDDEGDLSMKICHTNIWTRKGFTKITDVKISADTQLRHAILDDQFERVKITNAFDADISMVMNEAATKLYNGDKNFKAALDSSITNQKEEEDKFPRWDFLKFAIRPLTELTVSQWRKMRPKDKENLSAAEKERFSADYLAPASAYLTDKEEKCEDVARKKNMKQANTGHRHTNIKYMIMLMDILCEKKSPNPPEGKEDDVIIVEKPPTAALEKKLDDMAAQILLLATQLNLREAVTTTGMQAIAIRLPKNDDRGRYKALQAFADKIANPKADISMSNDSASIALSEVIFQAQSMWNSDKTQFQNTFTIPFAAYEEIMVKAASAANRGGDNETMLFCNAHPSLEIRTILKGKDGKVTTHSTLKAGTTPTNIGFLLITDVEGDKDQCNIGAVKKNAGAEPRYLFATPQEADQAQCLLVATMSEPKAVSFSLPPAGANRSKSDFMKAIKESSEAAKTDARHSSADWSTVSNSRKEKEKKKEKKKQDKSAQKQKEQDEKARNEQQWTAMQNQQAQLLQQQSYMLQQQSQRPAQSVPQQQPVQAPAQHLQQPAIGGHAHHNSHNHTSMQVPNTGPGGQQWNPGGGQQQWPPLATGPGGHQMNPGGGQQQWPPLAAGPGGPGGGHQLWSPLTSGQQQWAQVVGNRPQYQSVTSPWPTNVNQAAQSGPQMSGEPVVPAVVVFNDIARESLKVQLIQMDPNIAAAVVAITQEQGPKGTRAVLHCKASDVVRVQTLIPLLRGSRLSADVYIARKSQQASQGMQAASSRAGMCHNFVNQRSCPFQGKCKFKCYDQ